LYESDIHIITNSEFSTASAIALIAKNQQKNYISK
jgi:hypothetical protein